MAAGSLHALGWQTALARDCRFRVGEGEQLDLTGVVESVPSAGRWVLRVERGMPSGCRERVRVILPVEPSREVVGAGASETGSRVQVTGAWRRLASASLDPRYAGELVARTVDAAAGRTRGAALLRRRAELEARLARLYPERHGVVSALILSSTEGITPELRDAFARAGTAHILSISGFHVAVVAAILIGFVRALGVAARPAGALAAAAVWAYVLFIGAPDAAARAALIVTLFALASLRGRPLSPMGGLATSFLAMVLWDAGALARVGFQLSFAGVLGLVALSAPFEALLRPLLPWKRLRALRSAVAAGLAATLCTTPVVVWHFDQVSLVGIPATLVSSPLVAAAIPGAFASLALDGVSQHAGAFVAGGTDLLVDLFLRCTEWLGALPFAVAWVPRAWLFAAVAGAVASLVLLSSARRLGGAVRGVVAAAGMGVGVLLLPLAERVSARGTVELLVLDVGQGDAILIRSPGARWILVDAGPPAGFRRGGDAAVMAELRRRGVERLEVMFLTHPHLDHIGGAADVLHSLDVAAVVDPGMPRGTGAFVDVLEAAAEEGTGWRAARDSDWFPLDGVDLRVLSSLQNDREDPAGGDEVNESSLVVLLTFGAFSALLTGDAPVEVEQAAARTSGPVDVLKVGHHGSRTSTSAALLGALRPGTAVISLGRGNRYGHPHAPVLDALGDAGIPSYRTDQSGTVRVLARRDGSYRVTTERPAPGISVGRAVGLPSGRFDR